MGARVDGLFRYPVKGLSAQNLDALTLALGEGVPGDRAYGFARHNSGFDPQNPRPLPKSRFVVLARDPALALVNAHFDLGTQQLTLSVADEVRSFDVTKDAGRADAADFLAAFLGYRDDETPRLVSAAPHKFTDVSVVSKAMMNAVSLINADTVAAFGAQVGHAIDPARFRGNIVFSGAPAWSELDWVGREIEVGEVRLEVVKRTKRCPATEVNLERGTRDLDVPGLIRAHHGHSDMGIYAEVRRAGRIVPGDHVRPI
ncbi:MOSC domain-containing protein [uncultured Tateyamaria sp.]|uniref:MOSC domain-containing protein n=1 Tax=uncultured Tateyamaria sp. TaxID=455651 RepID=UPI002621DFF3|nr:MOSC domain-containing protein [uncultured Tateyamaria sp.]